jgi:hypothetical protein
MVETGGYNRGPFIDSANRRYAYLEAPYCASTVSVILDRIKAVEPKVRSASSRAFVTKKSVNAWLIACGKAKMPEHGLVIFARRGGGHIEFLISFVQGVMRCFGFNTSPDGKRGSQWNGTWSGYKNRSLKTAASPWNAFRVTHITPVVFRST